MNKTQFFIIATALLLVSLSLLLSKPVYGVYKYGYKKGDTCYFYMESSSTANTEEGTSKTSSSYGFDFKIKDVQEDESGHRVDIEYVKVETSGYGKIITEGHLEGDAKPFIGSFGGYLGLPVAPFITMDWEEREKEWRSYVKTNFESKTGYNIQSRTESNGVFALNVKLDVDDDDSTFDYDGDGDKDAYTGTITLKIEYNGDGVLSSYSMQSDIKFNDENTLSASMKAGKGQPSIIPGVSDILVYFLIIIIGIVAFVIGFSVGKSRTPRMPEALPDTQQEA